jgi:hypothetical protein
VSVEHGSKGSRGSAPRTLKMKQLMDGASRIEVVLFRGEAQQKDCAEGDDCRGHNPT